MLPFKELAFRDRYREEVLPPNYSGGGHVGLVLVLGSATTATAIGFAARTWRASDFWVVPATWLLANLVEYLAHRGPMHHRWRGLHLLHLRHTGRHHRYFTDRAMHFDSPHDFHAVLFPPVLLGFFGAIAAALGAGVALALTPAAAALFVAASMGYYLLYESLHFCYHLPDTAAAAHLPGVRWLARLHRLHHTPALMMQRNFNLVFPLFDWIFGTLDTGRSQEIRPTPAVAKEGTE